MLEDIIRSNNVNLLSNIKNTLNLNCVHNYIVENGIETKSIKNQANEYQKIFSNIKLEFQYKDQNVIQTNENISQCLNN